jgi:hypothetical protein
VQGELLKKENAGEESDALMRDWNERIGTDEKRGSRKGCAVRIRKH